MRTLLGVTANNPHTQQIALALHEAGMLSRCLVPWAALPPSAPLRPLHDWLLRRRPGLAARLRDRRPPGIPASLLADAPAWEWLRLAADRLVRSPRLADLVWEKSEHAFARACARKIRREHPDVFLGAEHGCLEALRAARRLGVLGGVIFLSPHHAFLERALAPVLARHPFAESASARRLRAMAVERDRRRDAELAAADFVHANSSLVARSLVDAGADPRKILTVPLGAPEPAPRAVLETAARAGRDPVFLYAGNASIRKGLPVLLAAWEASRPPPRSTLALYGRLDLPPSVAWPAAGRIHRPGPVPRAELWQAMRDASLLVFPTLCDGFGMVVTEALAQGLPVLTTDHCGAADLVKDGVNGFIVPAGDERALAERLDWCHRHPRELEAMRPAALASAAAWTWADYRRKLVSELLRIGDRQTA